LKRKKNNFKKGENIIMEEIIEQIHTYLETYEKENLLRAKDSIEIDWQKLSQFSFEVSQMVLDDFLNIKSLFQNVIHDHYDVNLEIRFKNLTESIYTEIWKIRNKHVGELVSIVGFVKKVGGIKHIISNKTFECINCGNEINLPQIPAPNKPEQCHCGNKKFYLKDSKAYDIQKIMVEEDPMILDFEQKPERKLVEMIKCLANPGITKELQPSVKVKVTGLVGERKRSPRIEEYTTFIQANNVEFLKEKEIKLSKKDIERIKEISKDDVLNKMGQSISPTIYGYPSIKKALFLQLIGATHIYEGNMLSERGTINILLVGSPGTAKTALIRGLTKFIDKARYTGSSTVSGAGLVATVMKDEEIGDWSLESGVIPMCNGGMAIIDEIDKISKSDIAYLNIAIDKLEVPFDKATIHTVLKTKTTILAAANPKDKVFDKFESIYKQINLPKDFLDRFDLIFAVEAIKDIKTQGNVIDTIFSKIEKGEQTKPFYDTETVKKYVSYVKQIAPILTKESKSYLKKEFLKLVSPGSEAEGAYFSSRLLINLIRLATASAKAHLRKEITLKDAEISLELMKTALISQQVIKDGSLDVVSFENILPKNKREKIHIIKEIIKDLDKEHEGRGAPIEKITNKAVDLKINEFELEEFLRHLRNGEIFEPTRGRFKLL